jgi:hypothetical protein
MVRAVGLETDLASDSAHHPSLQSFVPVSYVSFWCTLGCVHTYLIAPLPPHCSLSSPISAYVSLKVLVTALNSHCYKKTPAWPHQKARQSEAPFLIVFSRARPDPLSFSFSLSLADPFDDDPSPCAIICLTGLIFSFPLSSSPLPHPHYHQPNRCNQAIFLHPIRLLPSISFKNHRPAFPISLDCRHDQAFLLHNDPLSSLHLKSSMHNSHFLRDTDS